MRDVVLCVALFTLLCGVVRLQMMGGGTACAV